MKVFFGFGTKRVYPKFPDWVAKEINNKLSLRSNTKVYGGKAH
jgi:hypothetical protein